MRGCNVHEVRRFYLERDYRGNEIPPPFRSGFRDEVEIAAPAPGAGRDACWSHQIGAGLARVGAHTLGGDPRGNPGTVMEERVTLAVQPQE